MINLMKADLYRIFRSIGIYIAIAMVIAMSFTSIVTKEAGHIGNSSVSVGDTSVSYEQMDEEENTQSTITFDIQKNEMSSQDAANKLLVRSIIGANINLYYPLIIVVFVILAADFSNKTIKNTLTSSVSKRKYHVYKFLMCLGFSALFIIFSNLFTWVVNYIINGSDYTESIANIFKASLLQMPMLLGIVSILVSIAFLTRKAAAYNAISISLIMLFQIVLEMLYTLTQSETLLKYLLNYELQSALSRLAYFPKLKYCIICFGIGISQIIISAVFSGLIFKKSEIK